MLLPIISRLVYTWDGWPSQGGPPLPPAPDFSLLDQAWAKDGLRRVGCRWTSRLVQMTFDMEAGVSPVLFTTRVKGRLGHALRQKGTPTKFSRKVGMRAIGDNTDPVVAQYLKNQQVRGDFADPAYRRTLAEFSREFPDVHLDDPAETSSGRYWYNLHLVAVTSDRCRMGREDFLPKVTACVPGWAGGQGIALRAMALMPDHIHLAVRGDPAKSPEEIAGSLYRALNRVAGCRLFSDRVYAGTFSTYTRGMIGL